jgi:hypothetical protein
MSTSEHISPLSYILEPLIVAGLLTAGCLINRRTSTQLKAAAAAQERVPEPNTRLPLFKWQAHVPNNARFRANITSRFLAYFPFLMEVWYWLLTYWVGSLMCTGINHN